MRLNANDMKVKRGMQIKKNRTTRMEKKKNVFYLQQMNKTNGPKEIFATGK